MGWGCSHDHYYMYLRKGLNLALTAKYNSCNGARPSLAPTNLYYAKYLYYLLLAG